MGKRMVDPLAGADQMEIPPESGFRRGSQYDEYGEYYGDEYEDRIGVWSLSKARKYKAFAFVMLALSLLSCGAWFMFGNFSVSQRQSNCWTYELTVEQLAQKYVTNNGLDSYPAYIEDVPGFTDLSYSCPSGGSYTWNPVTGEYYCSEHGHHTDEFGEPTSTTQSVVTKQVENENS